MKPVKTALLVSALLILALPLLGARKKMLGEGEGIFRPVAAEGLASFAFDKQLSPEARAYLGLKKEGPFTLGDIDADLVVLEFLNVYCYACAMQAPVMNRVHQGVEARDDLRDRVRFFGIAVGNEEQEAQEFRSRFDIPYPVVADPEFFTLDAIGNPGGTPFTVLLPLGGEAALARAHLGVMADADAFVGEISDALAAGGAAAEREAYSLKEWRNLPPEMSAAEAEEKILSSAAEAGLAVVSVEPVKVPEEENVFRLKLRDGTAAWAKVAGRAKVCNVCHDIFFILIVDSGGRVLNFTPIVVTKYENELISEEEAAFLRGRVKGLSIREPVVFDAEVDAISQATMSSELIFDTLRRLGKNLTELP